MILKEVSKWRDYLNYVSSIFEELANFADEEQIKAIDKLDKVIDGLYNLEQELRKKNESV